MAVPNISQVRPGALVSIVLKADQQTGREVSGQVQDVLTRGNHPRGIKVRLRDGRIGRVQRMTSNDAAGNPHGAGGSKLSKETQTEIGLSDANSRITRPQFWRHAQDVRQEDFFDAPPEQVELMSYVKPMRQQKNRKLKPRVTSEQATTEITCPVCGDFKGDEAAVSHHVETHFSEA